MSEVADNKKNGLLARFGFGNSAPGDEVRDEQQQQLLQLFEKRNQLKREFGKTLDELETLKAQHAEFKEQHVQSVGRLAGLEAMLADPKRAQNAVIYYRLNTLWKHCRGLLEQRRAELIAKFEQLEKQKLLENFKTHAVELQRQLEQKFQQLDSIYQEMAGNLKGLQEQLRRSQKIWHYFRRKRLTQEVAAAEEQVAPVVAQRDACLAELERVRDREPPAYPGLSVQAKREINIQVIALAQHLYVHFSENDLSALARATQEKAPGESHYGTPQECLAMERPILEAVAKLKADAKLGDKLKRRADYLRQSLRFAGNADTVPEAEGLARIALSLGGTSQSIDAVRGDLLVNVLEQGYWNLDEMLLAEASEKQ